MTLLHDAINDKNYDTRLIEKNLKKGVLTDEQLQKYLGALPDDSANADTINVEELAKTL